MSTSFLFNNPVPATVLAGRLDQPLLESTYKNAGILKIDVPDFLYDGAAVISDVQRSSTNNEIVFIADVDDSVSVRLTLIGELIADQEAFQTREASFNAVIKEDTARADFIASTLMAMLALAEESILYIPTLELRLRLNFQSLKYVAEMLSRRLIAYRVMVIEKATGLQFRLPIEEYSREEAANIAFIYRAITERKFIWPNKDGKVTFFMPATREQLELMPKQNIIEDLPLEPMNEERMLFGRNINLGLRYLTVKDGALLNYDQVMQKLAENNNQVTEAHFISTTGRFIYEFPNAPSLPDVLWDEKIEQLIDIGDQLNSLLADRYNALAASAFEGLSEEEIKSVTQRENEESHE